MTTLQTPKKPAPDKSRAETVRQRRTTQPRSKPDPKKTKQISRQTYRSGSVLLPVESHPAVRRTAVHAPKGKVQTSAGMRLHSTGKQAQSRMGTLKPVKQTARQNGYDLAFSLGHTAVRAPTFNLPQLGPRWISAGLTLLLGLMVYSMWTANTFIIQGADVTGNQRLDAAEVSSALGVTGQPIIFAIPSEIERNLRTAFPDLAGVSVQVGFSNRIHVNVVERTPLLVWSQGDKITWIDSNGVSFMPRGNVPGLIPIAANGDPPKIAGDPKRSVYDQPFIAPDVVQAIMTLYPQVPAGSPMIYDPKYGMGWQDPRGWSVFFGQNTQDIPMKQKVYQAILDTITKQGVQPTLISVEYLDAPFYK